MAIQSAGTVENTVPDTPAPHPGRSGRYRLVITMRTLTQVRTIGLNKCISTLIAR